MNNFKFLLKKSHLLYVVFISLSINNSFSQSLDVVEKQKAIKLAKADTTKINLYLELADYYAGQNDTVRAIEENNKASVIAHKVNDNRFIEKVLLNQTDIHRSLGKISTAIELNQELIKSSKRSNDCKAEAHVNLAAIFKDLNDFDRAFSYALNAQKIYEKLNDKKGLIRALNIQVIVYYSMHEFDKAINICKQLEQIALQSNKKQLFGVYQNMGNCFFQQKGKLPLALESFEKAIGFAHQYGDTTYIGKTYRNLYNCYLDMNRYKEAEENLKISTKKFGYHLPARWAQAQILMNNIRAIKLYSITGRHKEEEKLIEQCLVEAKELDDVVYYEQLYEQLSQAYKHEGQYQKALFYFEKHSEILAKTKSIEKEKNIQNLAVIYETEKKEIKIEALQKVQKQHQLITLLLILAFVLFVIIAYFVRRQLKTALQATKQRQEHEREKASLELNHLSRELSTTLLMMNQKNAILHDIKAEIVQIDNLEGKRNIEKKIQQGITSEEDWKSFKTYFEGVNPQFFSKLRQISPNLTEQELRQCAFLKMNLTNKEIANLLNIAPDSVTTARTRIKKKLNISGEDTLVNLINSIS